jgi:hypothetical protein
MLAPKRSLSRVCLLVVLVCLCPGVVRGDRRDQKAAELYLDGVDAIKSGKYAEGRKLLNQALARGATEPNEQQGTESRYMARPYLPYYWLGVAEMELGEVERALINLEKEDGFGVIKKWSVENTDLARRKTSLEKRLAAALPPPVPTAPPALPTVTPVPVLPQPTDPAVVIPTLAVSVAVVATPAPYRTLPPDPLTERLLKAGLESLAAGEVERALDAAASARARAANDPRPYALEAAVRVNRYLLGGRRDTKELELARLAFAGWRSRATGGRTGPAILSPSARDLLR